jgi:osmotically-inducible protein OsmY
MVNTTLGTQPDVDIEADIRAFVRSFDPLKQSDRYFSYHVQDGVVTLKGNVRSAAAKHALLENLPKIAGVKAIHAEGLYDDDALRLAIGRLVPPGTIARVNYGRVVLSGYLPSGTDSQAVIDKVKSVAGVVADKVVGQFLN